MPNPPQLAKERRLIQLSPDVYVFGSYPFCGLIVTSEGCMAIDGPMFPTNVLLWREFIASKGPLRYQVLCEHHGDHVASPHLLQPDSLICSERTFFELPTTEELRGFFDTWAEDPRVLPEQIADVEMRTPDMTYSGSLTIRLGGKTFILYEAPGHTAGSTVVHAVEDRVAFIADLGRTPAIQDGNPYAWLATLSILEMLDVDWYVQGHGDPLRRDDLAAWRVTLLDSLERFRTLAAEGADVDAILEQGGVFPDFVRSPHTGTEDSPAGLRPYADAEFQRQGSMQMLKALRGHPSSFGPGAF